MGDILRGMQPQPIPSSQLPHPRPTPLPMRDPYTHRLTSPEEYASRMGVAEQPAIDPIADVLAPGIASHMMSPVGRALLGSEAGALGKPLRVPAQFAEESVVRRAPKGRPVRVYHGTVNEFEQFDPAVSREGLYGPGFYFTENPTMAGGPAATAREAGESGFGYATGRGEFLQRPKRIKELEKLLYDYEQNVKDLKRAAQVPPSPNAAAQLPEGRDHRLVGLMRYDEIASEREFYQARVEETRAVLDRLRQGEIREHPNVRSAYLNIRNPFRVDAEQVPEAEAKALMDLDQAEPNPVVSGEELFDWLADMYGDKQGATERLRELGYDGITHMGGVISGGKPHRVWIAFDPEQIIPYPGQAKIAVPGPIGGGE